MYVLYSIKKENSNIRDCEQIARLSNNSKEMVDLLLNTSYNDSDNI